MKKQSVCYDKYYKISKVLVCLLILFSLLPAPFTSILWCVTIFAIIRFIPRVHAIGKVLHTQNICFEAIICAVIFIFIQALAGIIVDDIGKSPYNHNIIGIINNIFLVFPALIGKELIRAYLLNTYSNTTKHNRAFALITTLMILIELNIRDIWSITSIKSLIIYTTKDIGPIIAINILLSSFAVYGGSKPSIIYASIVASFHWLSPILPSLRWITTGIIGITIPVFEVMVVFYKYKLKSFNVKHSGKLNKLTMGDISLFIVSVALIWFVIGVFPIYPSVIATGSMIPLIYPGDIILIKRVAVEDDIYNLKVGDVITFNRDNICITHRIIEIIQDEAGNLSFKTKGDNNSAEDSQLVQPNDICGTLSITIPKLGYPTLWFKSRSDPINDLEF